MNKYITLLLIGVITSLVALHLPTQSKPVSELETYTTAVYTLNKDVNQHRLNNGLDPVEIDARLMHSAQDKCEDMQLHGYWSHQRDGKHFADEILDYGIRSRVGENLAKDYDYTQATQAWINSETHNDNLLADWSIVGYGICGSKIVQHFAK